MYIVLRRQQSVTRNANLDPIAVVRRGWRVSATDLDVIDEEFESEGVACKSAKPERFDIYPGFDLGACWNARIILLQRERSRLARS